MAVSLESFKLWGCPYCGYRSGCMPVSFNNSIVFECGYVFEGLHRDDNYSDYFHRFNSTLVFSKLKSEFNKETKKK